jgi:hypothetical protein
LPERTQRALTPFFWRGTIAAMPKTLTMKKLLLILTLSLLSCSKKNELDSNFRTIIINYQKTYPVKNSQNKNQYIYQAVFNKEGNDTTITLVRIDAGYLKFQKEKLYGLYKDNELENFTLHDKSRLSINQVNVYKKNFPDSLLKVTTLSHKITPIAKFKIINKQPKLIKIDTVFSTWD